MANAANNAALKAAMAAGGYNSIQNMINNYVIPQNFKKQAKTNLNRKRHSNASYLTKNEANRIKANLQFDKEVIKNLIRMGIKSAKPTKQNKLNAAVKTFARKRAAKVIHRAVLKKLPVTAAKVKARKMKEVANAAQKKANDEKRAKNAANAARARRTAAEAARRVTVAMNSGAIGPRGKLTAAGRAVAPSGIAVPNMSTFRNRAQRPNAAVPQRANRGAPGAFAGVLSPDAVAAVHDTVDREVRAPPSRPSGARARIEKVLKKRR